MKKNYPDFVKLASKTQHCLLGLLGTKTSRMSPQSQPVLPYFVSESVLCQYTDFQNLSSFSQNLTLQEAFEVVVQLNEGIQKSGI